MSFFNALLGAINEGAGIYNDEKKFQGTLLKDKATYDNTRANTALNKQSFQHNELLNPLLLDKAKLYNKSQQQIYDFNEANNPLLIRNNELTNEGQVASNLEKQWQNKDTERRYNAYDSVMANPDITDALKHAYQMNYATGGKSFNPSKGSTSKPQIIGTFNDAGMRTGSAYFDPTTGQGVPIPIQGGSQPSQSFNINDVLNDAIKQTYGTTEFNSDANRADFINSANEVYQSFLAQTKNPDQALELTKTQMFKQLGLDDDTELGFLSDKELNYTPMQQTTQPVRLNSREEFDALPKGTPYILPNGQQGVK